MAVGGLLAVFGVAMLAQFRTLLFAAIAAMYLFLTICFDDACILDFLRKAGVYFIGKSQLYRWGKREVSNHKADKKQKK